MHEVEMLCLANSWKHGGRCVAGVRKTAVAVRLSQLLDRGPDGDGDVGLAGEPVENATDHSC